MRGSRNFSSGGGRGFQVHLAYKKSSATFFFNFLCPHFILQKSSGYFQRKLLFAKVPVGVEHFPTFYRSNCFFPIETHITCEFQGGPDRLPPPPPPALWIRPCDSAHRGLINLLVFLLSKFFNISSANSFVERGGNVASAAVLPVVVVTNTN